MTVIALKLPNIVPVELPPVACVVVGVGIGKTEAAIQIISGIVITDSHIRVVYAVPTHNLSSDICERFRAAGVTAGVWRGRKADDPLSPGNKMCLKPDAVDAVASLGMPIQHSMCRRKAETGFLKCESYGRCPYQQQANELHDMQTVIVAHDSLFFEMPAIGERNMLIIDEAFSQAGLRGL